MEGAGIGESIFSERIFSCKYCQKDYSSSQALGNHQKTHKHREKVPKSRLTMDKAKAKPDPDPGSRRVPQSEGPVKLGQAIEITSGLDTEAENSSDRRPVLVNKLCRICGTRGDHWTVQCLNYEDNAQKKLPTEKSHGAENMVSRVSETKSKLAEDEPEISYGMPYPGSSSPQPRSQVTYSQVIKIRDALEKENSPRWQALSKIPETCGICGLKLGKDCIHYDEHGTFKLPNCGFCDTFGDHWPQDCTKVDLKEYFANIEIGNI